MALENIRGGTLCQLLGNSGSEELSGIIGYVRALAGGKGPTSDAISSFSEFYKNCLKRFEYFFAQDFRVEEKRDSKKKGPCFTVKNLRGVQAILQLFLEISALVKKDEDIYADHVQPLRTYGWLLSLDQQKLVTKWVQKALQAETKLLSIQDSKKASASSGTGS